MPESQIIEHEQSSSFFEEIRQIIRSGQKAAYGAVNSAMVLTYWNVGKRIVEEEQNGKARAEYGKRISLCCPNNCQLSSDVVILKGTFVISGNSI